MFGCSCSDFYLSGLQRQKIFFYKLRRMLTQILGGKILVSFLFQLHNPCKNQLFQLHRMIYSVWWKIFVPPISLMQG